MKIAIGNDHAATQLKKDMIDHLHGKGNTITVTDLGAENDQGAAYPDYALRVSKGIMDGQYDIGLLLCGTGAGMCMAANKVHGIRAVVCSDPYTAQLSRAHNDANVLCMGARVVGGELAKTILDAFLEAQFEGGRHQSRIDMVMAIEKENKE